MPRIARKDSRSPFYHVIVQGMNKEFIFDNNFFIQEYKRNIIEKLKESPIKILAYCIMSNHAHFLIYSENSEYLSKYMQRLNISYSQFYNRTLNRVGYVFRNRYYSQDIFGKKQLYNCLAYIHNNPVKAKIVRNVYEYEHSSYNEFFGKFHIISKESIKLLFGNNEDYIDLFKTIHSRKNEEEFIDVKDKNIHILIEEIEEKYGSNIKDIILNKKNMQEVIIEARRQTKVTLVELAKILGVSKTTISKYEKM